MGSSKLRELRQHLGKTQQEFADELEVTRASISNYETGRREPDGAFFAKLKQRYNISERAIGEMLLDGAKTKHANTDH